MRLLAFCLISNLIALGCQFPSTALPPPEDTPEEILRTEIIFSGRSPIDGKYLTTAEYTQLQADLKAKAFAPQIKSDVQHLIFLLQIRQLFKTLIPFY